MPLFKIGDEKVAPDHPDYYRLLGAAYRDKVRPFCLCKEPPVEMYIARVGEKFFIKRMPYSGLTHAPDCESYEVPPELSGRGNLDGSAIRRHEDGHTTLKFDFSLSRHGASGERSEGQEKTSIKSPGSRMSLRATLHYLWDESGFTRWSPGMAGKRNWGTLRWFLLKEAADGKEVKRAPLTDILYIPEPFDPEKKGEISARRTTQLAPVARSNGKKLMLILGEVLRIEPGRFGFDLIFKHLPDYPFRLSDDANKSYKKHFGKLVGLAQNMGDGSHLIALGTFGIDSAFVPEISEITVMLTTRNWIPVENLYEAELVDRLTKANRRFVKGLRYDLRSTEPVVTATLTDTSPEAHGMYIVTNFIDQAAPSRESVDALIARSRLSSWVWDLSNPGAPPAFPEKAERPIKASQPSPASTDTADVSSAEKDEVQVG